MRGSSLFTTLDLVPRMPFDNISSVRGGRKRHEHRDPPRADARDQARGPHGTVRRGEDRERHRARGPGDRRARRGRGTAADARGGAARPVRTRRGDTAHRAGAGRRRGGAVRGRPPRDAARLHRSPRAAPPAAGGARHARRRRGGDDGVPRPDRLARQRQRQPGLFARRPDPQRLGQGRGELLARPRLPARDRPRPPRGRPAHPRPRHAERLLRRLVAAHPAERGPQRRAGQGGGGAAAAPVQRARPGRQLPGHDAERVGRCP